MVYTADNFEALRSTLEQASKIVTSPSVTKDQRTTSENYFIEFRKSKSPYEFCRYLLVTSNEQYVLFQAVSTLREATLREWTLLPSNLIVELEQFLLNFVVNSVQQNQLSDKYVQRQILQTIAVFYKRGKLDNIKSDSSQASVNMVKDVVELFKTGNVKLKQICLSLLLALLTEFSNTSRSTKLGLSNDSHFTAKRAFEQNEFKQMLMFIYETTHNLIESFVQNNIKSVRTIDTDSKEMLMQLFTLIDQSFNWEFTSSKHILKNLIVGFNANTINTSSYNSTVLEPTPEFKDFFLNPNLITLLFKCYELVRDDQDMAHAAMQPLIQLSTLNGPLFKDDWNNEPGVPGIRTEFLTCFIQSFLSSFSNIHIKEYESFNYACLIENLISSTNVRKFKEINPQIIEAFFNLVCQFVVNCFKAEKSCSDALDSKKYLESYEKVLIAWIAIKDTLVYEYSSQHLKEFNSQPNIFIFKNYAQTLFDAFLQSRLSSFNFQLDKENIQINDNGVDCESIDDDSSDSDDLHRYKEILYSIGEFSKFALEYCLPTLAKLLTEKYMQLIEVLSKIAQNQGSISDLEKHITALSEDIHWILLLSGFMLFEINSDSSEETYIPNQIMDYSIVCSKFVDSSLIHRLFTAILMPPESQNYQGHNLIPNKNLIETRLCDFEHLDPIIKIILNSFQLCELENQMFSLNMLSVISPQVASTLMWFLKEFARNYLFMKEESYTNLSLTLQSLFGQETECANSTLSFLLRKLHSNFFIWSSENTTTSHTAKLLLEIVRHKQICKILLQNEKFWSISKIAVVNEMPWLLLPSSVKKIIIKSLVVSCSSNNSSGANDMQAHFYNTILQPLTIRFDTLANVKSEVLHRETCIKEVMSLIETFNGIIEGASKNIIKHLLPFVIPRLQQGVQLLDVYHNYGEIVELILCMYNGVIEKFLPYISDSPDARNQIYHCFLCLIQVFSRHNTGKRSTEANIEEDYFNDLLLFMTLLNTLHNIDNDFDEPQLISNSSTTQTENGNMGAVDIILMGLEFLIPLMNQEMLKIQVLCTEYFKLISHTAFSNAAKLYSRSFDLFQTLINSIEYGINSGSGTEIVRLCLDCIIPLCKHVYVTETQQTNYGLCLSKLFKTVFDMIFRNSFEMELFEVSAGVLYSFICCFQDVYSKLVTELVSQYEDESLKQKIVDGFRSLTPANFNFNMEKRNRVRFSAKFNEFCVKTYGLLFIR